MKSVCYKCGEIVVEDFSFPEKILCYNCFEKEFSITCYWCKSLVIERGSDEHDLPVCIKMGSKKYGKKIHPGLEICPKFEGKLLVANEVKLKPGLPVV